MINNLRTTIGDLEHKIKRTWEEPEEGLSKKEQPESIELGDRSADQERETVPDLNKDAKIEEKGNKLESQKEANPTTNNNLIKVTSKDSLEDHQEKPSLLPTTKQGSVPCAVKPRLLNHYFCCLNSNLYAVSSSRDFGGRPVAGGRDYFAEH